MSNGVKLSFLQGFRNAQIDNASATHANKNNPKLI